MTDSLTTLSITNKVQEHVKEYTTHLHKDNLIDYETLKYLSSNSEPKAGRFYLLSKIHKQGNPGQPIISSNGHPTERISEFVDYHLKPLVQTPPSFIKDTTHFLLQLQKLGPLPNNAILVTLDVSSLYTNIPHNKGIDACCYFLNTRQDKSLPVENVCDLIRMILTMNNFSFNNKHYLQKHGTATGTCMAPSYANLFMSKFEQQAIDNSLLKPFIWWRFINDIFMIWTHGEEHLKSFIGFLNSIHHSIKFTHEYSNSLHQTLPFLDVQVHLINNHIETDLHTKPTDKHQYLLKTSCHLNHTKKPSHSASSSESVTYVLPTLSLTNEAMNSSNTLSNVLIVAPHYKEMRIVFAQFHVMQPFNRKKKNPPRLTEHPLSHPSTLRYLKYHLLSTSIPLSFNPLPTAKKPSLTHQL